MTPNDFVKAIGPAARELAAATKIPASFTVAQAALESGWATSDLAQKYFNLFGVKADGSWKGAVVWLPTKEYVSGKPVTIQARWRVYPDWLSSIRDRAQFLLVNKRYAGAFSSANGPDFARAVAAAGYATDPDYAKKIVSIITSYKLTALDV
ncbi:glycoside hydrolase family 73 protein [Burkholderia sp. 22PA0099]|uniref:glycoside hydrolase family 73 protein n=1 Tax=Burkholderia sp. 22PA0099 TaxID=3237372 RepID=UPI0039C4920A